MAELVLGIGTSHTPMLSLPPEMWSIHAQGDRANSDLVFPPEGKHMSFEEGAAYVATAVREKQGDLATFQQQSAACTRAVETLAATLQRANPDITIIISDDQEEWFYDDNMPRFAVYWGDTVRLIPRSTPTRPGRDPEVGRLAALGYGDVEMDVPVASRFGRHLVDYLLAQDFDISQLTTAQEQYGGQVRRRYRTENGDVGDTRQTPKHTQGLPHGFAFVVKRLFDNKPGPILPVFQNTCYPPNVPTPRRSYQLGRAIAGAVKAWPEDARVAVVASGGLSHFVVDEEIDQMLLQALKRKDAAALQSLPEHRLRSATSESLNWIALGATLEDTPLRMELLDYVAVYRSEAGTGGGWAFAQWV